MKTFWIIFGSLFVVGIIVSVALPQGIPLLPERHYRSYWIGTDNEDGDVKFHVREVEDGLTWDHLDNVIDYVEAQTDIKDRTKRDIPFLMKMEEIGEDKMLSVEEFEYLHREFGIPRPEAKASEKG